MSKNTYTVTLSDGNTYQLKYNFNALCKIEEVTGKAFSDVVSTQGLSTIRLLLWAGISHGTDKDLTVEIVGELMESGDVMDYIQAIQNAIEASTPKATTKKK